MSAPASRRGFVLGLAALPAAGTVAAAMPSDPHVALGEEAIALWRQVKALMWGWDHPEGTPDADAATAAQEDFMEHCLRVVEMPPPETLPGLRALAVTMALLHEECWTENLCAHEESVFRFLEQVLAMTGAVMPEGFIGLAYRPRQDFAAEASHAEG